MADDPNEATRTVMSVEDRIALVEAIERREAGAVRKAAGVAWLSLAVAASLLGLLIFGAWSQLQQMRAEVASLEQQQRTLAESTKEQEAKLAQVDTALRDRVAALSTLIGAVRRTDERARGGLETALDADPVAATLVPRAYVAFVEESDRQWARNLSDRLQQGGVIPVAIEHMPGAMGLDQFEIRYSKPSERDGALRIQATLKSVGVPAELVLVEPERLPTVRQNRFEIWCPENAKRFKLPPLKN